LSASCLPSLPRFRKFRGGCSAKKATLALCRLFAVQSVIAARLYSVNVLQTRHANAHHEVQQPESRFGNSYASRMKRETGKTGKERPFRSSLRDEFVRAGIFLVLFLHKGVFIFFGAGCFPVIRFPYAIVDIWP
jgi:hypothetical protein